MTVWRCIGKPPQIEPCGAQGTREGTGAGTSDEHTKATGHSTASGSAAVLARMTACQVTVWDADVKIDHRRNERPCGQPVVAGRLCQHHEDERVRLGGGA